MMWSWLVLGHRVEGRGQRDDGRAEEREKLNIEGKSMNYNIVIEKNLAKSLA